MKGSAALTPGKPRAIIRAIPNVHHTSLVLEVFLALGCARAPASLSPRLPRGEAAVGFAFLETQDPLTQKPLKGIVFYPPEVMARGATEVGPYLLEAQQGVAIQSGRHPLVVISHGHAGSRFGHHDLAEHLARAGYVVAAVEHAGDSWSDQSAFGTDRAMRGRAYQVSAMIDAVLADPKVGPRVDAARIGIAGFSAGGYTALVVLGAEPDFSLARGYCARHPADKEICRIKKLAETQASPPPMVDARVKAGFVMAPLGIFFGSGSLDAVKAPIYLVHAERDPVLLPEENAEPVRRGLRTLVGSRVVPAAGHYVFLSPCGAALAREAPVLCEDPPGVDRVSVHADLAREARAFFDEALAASPAR